MIDYRDSYETKLNTSKENEEHATTKNAQQIRPNKHATTNSYNRYGNKHTKTKSITTIIYHDA